VRPIKPRRRLPFDRVEVDGAQAAHPQDIDLKRAIA
jgi:hypothetical protein